MNATVETTDMSKLDWAKQSLAHAQSPTRASDWRSASSAAGVVSQGASPSRSARTMATT